MNVVDTILGVDITTSLKDGYINISGLIKYYGSGKKYSNWTRQNGTKSLISEVSKYTDIQEDKLKRVVKGKDECGVYIHYILAVAYAEWCSPAFHIAIIELVRKYNNGNLTLIKDIMDNYNNKYNTESCVHIYTKDRDTYMNEVYIKEWLDKDSKIFKDKDARILELEEMIAQKDTALDDQAYMIGLLEAEISKNNKEISALREENESMVIETEGKSIVDILEYSIESIQEGDDSTKVLRKLRGIETKVTDIKKILMDRVRELMVEHDKYKKLSLSCMKFLDKNTSKKVISKLLSEPVVQDKSTPTSIITGSLSPPKKKELLNKKGYVSGSITYYIYEENIPELSPAYSIECAPPKKDKLIVYAGMVPNKKRYAELCITLGSKYNIYNNSQATIYHKTKLDVILGSIKEFDNTLLTSKV